MFTVALSTFHNIRISFRHCVLKWCLLFHFAIPSFIWLMSFAWLFRLFQTFSYYFWRHEYSLWNPHRKAYVKRKKMVRRWISYTRHTTSYREWKSEVTKLCPTLCNPMDCSPPGSCVHEISQARILEWVAISFSRGSSLPRIIPGSSALQADSLPPEPQGKQRMKEAAQLVR